MSSKPTGGQPSGVLLWPAAATETALGPAWNSSQRAGHPMSVFLWMKSSITQQGPRGGEWDRRTETCPRPHRQPGV